MEEGRVSWYFSGDWMEEERELYRCLGIERVW